MIISCSRRTDIPAFYSNWFFKRLEEGFVETRNPFNPKQISKISLKPEAVECFVFWTKNPKPMLNKLKKLSRYPFYFQFTLNGYGLTIEKNLPDTRELIDTFKALSEEIGEERVVWRYDPVLLSKEYNLEFHKNNFKSLAESLGPYTKRCVFSFIDNYKKILKRVDGLGIREPNNCEMLNLAKHFKEVAIKNGFDLKTCGEEIDLLSIGIKKNSCIDDELIQSITGKELFLKKDTNQRGECLCVKSRDIGEYNSCLHNCIYCYANGNTKKVRENIIKHNYLSNFLIG